MSKKNSAVFSYKTIEAKQKMILIKDKLTIYDLVRLLYFLRKHSGLVLPPCGSNVLKLVLSNSVVVEFVS